MAMRRGFIAGVVVSAGVAAGLGMQQGQGGDPMAGMSPEMAEGMQKWMEMMTPGEPHKQLADRIGTWTGTMKVWMDPSQPPMESAFTAVVKWKLEGRFIEEEFKAEFMGQPFTGYAVVGYDNYAKQYVSTWIDSMNTAMSMMKGSMSPDGTMMTMFGQMNEPMTGELGKTVMYRTTEKSKDQAVMEAFEVQYGEPFKVMEITYNRKK